MIGCSTIAFTPTPMGQVLLLGSLVGRRDPRAKPEAIVEPLPLPIRPGVTTIGAAAISLAPSPTAGTDG